MFVSVVIARGLVAELQNHGISQARAMELLELAPESLSDLRSRMSFAELDRLVLRTIKLSGDAGLGLSVGMHAPEHMLQLLGHLLVSCRTLRHAFVLFEHFMPLVVDGVRFGLTESQDVAQFDYHCPVPMEATSRFAAEAVLLSARRIANLFFASGTMRPHEVHFEHEAPEYRARYQDAFDCPVMFGRRVNRIVFPRWVLDELQAHADSALHAGLRELAERMLAEMGQPAVISARVRDLLRYHTALSTVSTEELARTLGLTARSLRRRLAAEGLSMTTLVDETRFKLACEGLQRQGSIKEIAERLGFSEPSAFHRAFKRWTGQTPLEYARRALPPS